MTEAVAVAATEPVVPAVAPVVAPPAAPVTPVVPTTPAVVPPVASVPEVPAEGAAIEYESTGDPGLDVALDFIGKLGLGPDHPAMVAAMAGDFNLLKATMGVMGARAAGWERMVALGEAAHAKTAAAAEASKTAITDAVHKIAGGADNWTAIQTWAAGEATPEEKAELNKLFDSGAMGARAAATLLTQQYNAAKGTVVNPAAATRGHVAPTATTPTNGPLSSREYGAAVRELHAKLGNRMDASPEYAALRARLSR